MCPVCLATAAWIAAGVTSTGGVSALAIGSFRKSQKATTDNRNQGQGGRDGQEH